MTDTHCMWAVSNNKTKDGGKFSRTECGETEVYQSGFSDTPCPKCGKKICPVYCGIKEASNERD